MVRMRWAATTLTVRERSRVTTGKKKGVGCLFLSLSLWLKLLDRSIDTRVDERILSPINGPSEITLTFLVVLYPSGEQSSALRLSTAGSSSRCRPRKTAYGLPCRTVLYSSYVHAVHTHTGSDVVPTRMTVTSASAGEPRYCSFDSRSEKTRLRQHGEGRRRLLRDISPVLLHTYVWGCYCAMYV